jgi:hypothetical protein
VELQFQFSSSTAEEFFNCGARNIEWMSGYGAGKTYAAMQKAIALMCKFPGYRVAIGRFTNKALQQTTKKTFFKVCPPELYADANGGRNVQESCTLFNKSEAVWMHFDDMSEGDLKSLEVNMAIVDQAEEISESVYLTLDSRVGRWDKVTVPGDIPNPPINAFTGAPMAPSYMILLANPPDEGEYSYLWQRFHPESQIWQEQYSTTHKYFESASFENKALPPENLKVMLSRDPEWVRRYVYGKFSKGEGAIHEISPLSILEVDEDWVRNNILKKGSLARVLDHGASSPTACTWWAALNGIYFCYREYYQPDKVISEHRRNITDLSRGETYSVNLADPSIFRKSNEKYGGFWSVADEYLDPTLDSPPIGWSPADNNEFATRNRINELLRISGSITHPNLLDLNQEPMKGAPRVYFIKKTKDYAFGCDHILRETASQRKKLLDEVNGKKIYSDEREASVSDHSYDTFRYYCASHLASKSEGRPKPKPGSFFAARDRIKAVKIARDMYGMSFNN